MPHCQSALRVGARTCYFPSEAENPMPYIGSNRRIGDRTDVRIPVTLQRQPARGFLARRARHVEAVIMNASVSGLEVECHPLPGAGLRDHLIIKADKGTATVELRRTETLGPKRVHYGLLLLESDPAFDAAIRDITATLRTDSVNWRWETAR